MLTLSGADQMKLRNVHYPSAEADNTARVSRPKTKRPRYFFFLAFFLAFFFVAFFFVAFFLAFFFVAFFLAVFFLAFFLAITLLLQADHK
jgi:hypothetical protein